jgi:hypothetical protein
LPILLTDLIARQAMSRPQSVASIEPCLTSIIPSTTKPSSCSDDNK